MPLDHSKANVTISVAGLALSCINKRKQNRCEIGILRCDRHSPALDIQRIELDPYTKSPLRSTFIPHSLNLDEDIFIDAVRENTDHITHCERGTSTYMRRGFDRLDDIGDEDDFRWVPDLEGPEFHNRKLRIKRRSILQPTIFLSDGILYTRQKTDERFARISLNGKPSPVPLGKFAHGLSADIMGLDGGELVLGNRSEGESPERSARCLIRLPQSDYVKYLITIENECLLGDETDGTDFRLFYEAVKDPDGQRFDLRRIVETGCYAEPEDPIEGRKDFSLDGFPEKCMVGFLGKTDTLKTDI